jgi:hypothetical protein
MQSAGFTGFTPEQKHLKTNRMFEMVTKKKVQYNTHKQWAILLKKGIGLYEGGQKLVIYRYHANVSHMIIICIYNSFFNQWLLYTPVDTN